MVKLNTKPLKSDMQIQKNVLYQINENTTVSVREEHKHIYTLILDMKKNISAFSDNLLKDDALLSAIHEVDDFIEQLRHAMLHKDSILLFHKDEGYTETAEVGIATRRFEREKFLKVAEFLEGLAKWQKPLNIQPLLWYKLKNNLMPYVSASAKIRNFAENKVCVCGYFYQLQVYLLKWLRDSEYAVSVEIGLDV